MLSEIKEVDIVGIYTFFIYLYKEHKSATEDCKNLCKHV